MDNQERLDMEALHRQAYPPRARNWATNIESTLASPTARRRGAAFFHCNNHQDAYQQLALWEACDEALREMTDEKVATVISLAKEGNGISSGLLKRLQSRQDDMTNIMEVKVATEDNLRNPINQFHRDIMERIGNR